jgi:hypothetical protein
MFVQKIFFRITPHSPDVEQAGSYHEIDARVSGFDLLGKSCQTLQSRNT